jgi:hypothetical protein
MGRYCSDMDPSPTDLLDRIVASDAAYTLARLGVIARWEGNPLGVASRQEGDAHGFQVRAIPSQWLNRVIGLRDAQADRVPAFVAWFTRYGIHARFETLPDRHGNEAAKMLGHCGFVQSGFDAMSWGVPRSLIDWGVARSGAAAIEIVETEAGIEEFLDSHLEAWAMPERTRERARRNMRGWRGLPDWTLLLARQDGMPAATAVLHVAEGIAYIADTATRPGLRNRGAQTALLRHCLNLAGEQGAELVWTRTAFNSTSHRNMLRAGLRTLCTPGFWTPVTD